MFVKIVYVPNPKYIFWFFDLFYIDQYTFLLCGRIFILPTVFVKKKTYFGPEGGQGGGGGGGGEEPTGWGQRRGKDVDVAAHI